MNNKGNSVVIKEGLRLYKQARSPNWTAVVRVGVEEIRKSTRTPDIDAAKDFALELAIEARVKSRMGVSIKNVPSFKEVANQVVTNLESTKYGKANDKAINTAIRKYLIPYLGKKPVNKIDRREIHNFYEWREQETGKEISPTQRSNTDSALRRIFDLACDLGHLSQANIPKLPKPAVRKSKPRDYFSVPELKKVFAANNIHGFIAKSRNYKTRNNRKLFQYYITFLFFTGARPGEEVVKLRYSDIRFVTHKNKKRCVANITKGKTTRYSHGREIFVDEVGVAALRRPLKFSRKHGFYQKIERVIDKTPDDYIFSAYEDNDVVREPNFIDVMDQYMDYLKLTARGHSLYSFRHTYITYKLLKDVSAYDIAKQCGTSEAMINQFYDHVRPLQKADKLEFGALTEGVSFEDWLIASE